MKAPRHKCCPQAARWLGARNGRGNLTWRVRTLVTGRSVETGRAYTKVCCAVDVLRCPWCGVRLPRVPPGAIDREELERIEDSLDALTTALRVT